MRQSRRTSKLKKRSAAIVPTIARASALTPTNSKSLRNFKKKANAVTSANRSAHQIQYVIVVL
jgi:hypothetical protein